VLEDAEADDRVEANPTQAGVDGAEIVGEIDDDIDSLAGRHVDPDLLRRFASPGRTDSGHPSAACL